MPDACRRWELGLLFFPRFSGAGGAFRGGGGKVRRPSSGFGEGSIKAREGVWLLDIGVLGGGILGGGPLGGLEGMLLEGGRDALYGTSLTTSFTFLCCRPASNPPDESASGLYCWKACCVGDGILCSASTMFVNAGGLYTRFAGGVIGYGARATSIGDGG